MNTPNSSLPTYPEHEGRPLVSTKLTDPALLKSADDEPIFTLVARDVTAVDAVQKWIERNINRLGHSHPKITSAVATRNAMEAWANRKLPS